MTIPLWEIWDHDRTDRPIKKIDRTRITQTQQKKYKIARITTKLKVKERTKSTSQATKQMKRKTYIQVKFDELEAVVMEKNDALYGDAFND